jgi:SdpC family antimicrobial peptide
MDKMLVKRLGAAVMAVVTFATFGCGGAMGADPQGDSSNEVQQARLDGRALYTGMFFGVGPGAKLFPEIWENDALDARAQRQGREAEFETAANGVADKLAARDAAFFDRFAAGIQSGDHLRIEQTMKDAREQTRAVVAEMRNVPADQVGALQFQAEAGLWLYVETAVAVVAVAVVVLVVIDISVAEGPSAQGRLGMDTWVDILANKDFSARAQ